jgi:putative transcriptional regulator
MSSFDQEAKHLDGKLLIAMPSMGDPRFNRSVVYLCAHSDDGAMGLIVNKPAEDLDFNDLLEQLDIKVDRPIEAIDVHYGGPVEHGRGFVLHSRDYEAQDATLNVNDHFGMTATLDILEDISQGHGPESCLLALGYAGWGPGQLEDEIRENGWLTCDANASLVFSDDHDGKWNAAMKVVGIDPRMLSSEGGRA